MRRMVLIVKKALRILIALLYLFVCRIKNIGKKRGVAQVVESFRSGGLEQVAANIYKGFKENGDISTVISVSNNLGPMCNQLYSPADLRIVYYDVAGFIRYCAKMNIGTLLFHFTTFKMPFLKLLGFKNYYIVHNTYLWYTEDEWKKLKIKLKFVNGIIAVSEWCKDYFVKKTGIKDVKVILNGIDFDNLDNNEPSDINRKNLKIDGNKKVCLTVGSYTEGKHQMAIIGIAEKMLEYNKDIVFICAGPVLDENYYKKFRERLDESPAKHNIISLKYVPQEQMGEFISENCDIYLQPSVHEAGVPLTVMEALLRGKPVVMTDFMVDKTFPNSDRIIGVTHSFKNILDLTPEMASELSCKCYDSSTDEFVDKILETYNKLDEYEKTFDRRDYEFVSRKNMANNYLDYIVL